jgi:hypothetical protein
MTKHRKVIVAAIATVAALATAGGVLATGSVGLTSSFLANQVSFGPINVTAHATNPSVWQMRLKTKGMSDGYVVDNKLAPGGTTGWHGHPGPSLIFVVAGTVTNYEADDPTCTGTPYSAGHGFVDSGQDVHTLRNEGTVEAETIAVQLVPAGATRRIDVTPGPSNCPF